MSANYEIISPVDGRCVAAIAYADPSAVDEALTKARRAQALWSRTSIGERARLCRAFVEAMLGAQGEIASDDLLRMLSENPQYLELLEPFLSEEQIQMLMKKATDEPGKA